MDERLLDYLYGELEADDREAFERALPAFPEVAAELERHRWTRTQMAKLPVVALPAGALDAALAAATAAAASAAPAEAKPTLWERLRRWVVQPSFAMALVALVGVGIGLYTMKGGRLPSEPEPVSAQEGAGRAPVAVTPPPAGSKAEVAEASPTMQAAPVAPPAPAPTEAPAPESAAGAKGAGGGGEQPVVAVVDRPADKAPAKELAKLAEPARAPLAAAVAGPEANDEADDFRARAAKIEVGTSAGDVAGGMGFAGEDGLYKKSVPTVAEPRFDALPTEPAAPRAGTTSTADMAAETVVVEDSAVRRGKDEAERPMGGAVLTPPRDEGKTKAPVAIDDEEQARPAPKPDAKPAAEKRPESREAGRTADSSNTQSPTAPRTSPPAPTSPPPPPKVATEESLWTTYGQQLAAGAWADAQKTLAELAKVAGETAKVKAARTSLAKQVEDAKKAEAERAKPAEKAPPEPASPLKQN